MYELGTLRDAISEEINRSLANDVLTLYARAGIVGEIRKRWVPWLP